MNLKACLQVYYIILAGCSSGNELNRESMVRNYEQQKEIFSTANSLAEGYYEAFMESRDDYWTNLKDKNWQQIVSTVYNTSKETVLFLDEYRKGLKLEAGIDTEVVNFPDAYFNRKPSTNYFIKKGRHQQYLIF
ncbi:MAG: hypothetical protein IPP73_03910 [Chitinophagaceae bacterium]|nr:hypothetical protein [Chitinophagaceae bacterium]